MDIASGWLPVVVTLSAARLSGKERIGPQDRVESRSAEIDCEQEHDSIENMSAGQSRKHE